MCDQNRPTEYFELVEVPIDSTSKQKFLFQVDQNLQDAKAIYSIRAYRASEVSQSVISGSNVVNDTVFAKAFLVLVKGKDEKVQFYPLTDLNPRQNYGLIREFNLPDGVDITKCYVQVASTGSLNASEVFLFGFDYKK